MILVNNHIQLPDAIVRAIVSQNPVHDTPHNFYKYPARFTPEFPREIISHFSHEGDTVIDPFCGSGTSLVEAISLGRRAVGFDISSLAAFLSRVKTTPLSCHDNKEIVKWLKQIEVLTESQATVLPSPCPEREYYQKNAPRSSLLFFNAIVEKSTLLPNERQRKFIRLVLLGVGQWALDCKTVEPTWNDLRTRFLVLTEDLVRRYYQYVTLSARNNEIPRCKLLSRRRVINRSSEESGVEKRIPESWLPAKLVVTSPPYPGVHVLYHRWQVNGRRETPLPFWLAASREGAGESYYCLGRRSEPALATYFRRLKGAFDSLRKLLAKDALLFQLVAFSKPEWQLPRYLETMMMAGYRELLPECHGAHLSDDGRIWRNVPGRKWYANANGRTSANKEVLLIHTPVG